MEQRLTEEMLYKVAKHVFDNWETDTIIDELIWLYDNLAKHDKALYKELIWNAENLEEK